MQRLLTIILLCLTVIAHSAAYHKIELSPNATVSLLTCTPGTEIYSKYGHSAIRIQDPEQEIDWTFNYGVFSFNTDYFYLKFVRGETWYQLNVESTDRFILSSTMIGRSTYEQVLNLTDEEKQKMFNMLLENYEPQNRFYLYNFVFDNCATRPYALLKAVIPELKQVVDSAELLIDGQMQPTFRQLIRYYSGNNSWIWFGIDFIFGSDADKQPTAEQRLFLPEQLMSMIDKATLSNGTSLCNYSDTKPFKIQTYSFIGSPYIALIVLTLFMLVLTIYDIKRRDISWWFDDLLLFFGFLLGTIGFYLAFFSIHPLVKHNWNILFVSPLLIVPAIMILIPKCRQFISEHLYLIGIGWLCFMFGRVILIMLQSWHWLMLIPILHGLRIFAIGKANNKSRITYGANRFHIVISLLLCFVASPTKAEPQLTVVISVDGLNIKALSELRSYWQQGGLRTLDEEAHFSSVSFPQLVYGGTETLASIVCGSTPSVHGITSDFYFNRQDRKIHNIFDDNKQKGIGTDRQVSAEAIRTLTLTDEFRIAHTEESKIYAIGINTESTILLAGHAANACAWLEERTLSWATTGYYSEGLPSAADEMNVSGRIARLASEIWTPRMDIPMYMHPTEQEKQHSFSYMQSKVLTRSPAANTLVIELALALQKKEGLGTNRQADMLLLSLNVSSPTASSDLLESAEQEDMYIRLNQDLGWLMEQLNKRIGKDNYRLILFGTPHYGRGSRTIQKANLQVRYFNTERIAALCNTYLMAIYGHERWIDGGYANNIFLNRTLIEQKKISFDDIRRKVSGFLLEAEGTYVAFASTDLAFLPLGGEEEKLRLTLNKHTAGDVVFLLEPLWFIGEDENRRTDFVADTNPQSPFMLWTTEIITMPDRQLSATQLKDIILK